MELNPLRKSGPCSSAFCLYFLVSQVTKYLFQRKKLSCCHQTQSAHTWNLQPTCTHMHVWWCLSTQWLWTKNVHFILHRKSNSLFFKVNPFHYVLSRTVMFYDHIKGHQHSYIKLPKNTQLFILQVANWQCTFSMIWQSTQESWQGLCPRLYQSYDTNVLVMLNQHVLST